MLFDHASGTRAVDRARPPDWRSVSQRRGLDRNDPTIPSSKHQTDDQLLRQARHDVRVAGWTLAVERALSERLLEMRGPEESVISPQKRSKSGDGPMLALGDLCLPGGRTPHDFMRTAEDGSQVRGRALPEHQARRDAASQEAVRSCSSSSTIACPRARLRQSSSATTTSRRLVGQSRALRASGQRAADRGVRVSRSRPRPRVRSGELTRC